MRRVPALPLACALAIAIAGCGTAGTSPDATVAVYASVPLHGPEAATGRSECNGAKRALAAANGKAGDLHVHLTCLDASAGVDVSAGTAAADPVRPWTLAAVGANARHAVEDSSTVAYIGELSPAATRFSAPILEAAEIGQLPAASAEAAMQRILTLIAENSDTPRESIFESLSGS